MGLAFWRWALAAALVLPFSLPALQRDWPAIWRHRWYMLAVSALGVAGFNTFLYIGLHHTTALNASSILSTIPVLIVLSSFLLFRTPMSAREAVGATLCLVGALEIATHGDLIGLLSLQLGYGDFLILLGCICYGLYGALLRGRPQIERLSFLAATFVLGLLVQGLFYLVEIASGAVVPLSLPSVAAIVYVGVFPSILSYFFFNYGVEMVGANRAGLFMNLVPVFGAVLAIVLLHEAVASFHLIGALLIAAGLLLATRSVGAR